MITFALARVCGYGLEKGCLDATCSAKSPEDTRQSKHQLAFYGRFGVIVGNHRGFKGLVILCILERINDGLGGEAVTHTLGARCFVEIGPRSMLLKHIADSLEGVSNSVTTLPVLGTSDQDSDPFPGVISKAIINGAKIDTTAVFGSDPGAAIVLPSYPWQQTKYRFTSTVEAVGFSEGDQHPLAGGRFTQDALEWYGHVDTMLFPELADHRLGSQIVLPSTAFFEIALFVARQWLKSKDVALANFETLQAIDLTKSQTIELRTRVSPASNTIEIFSRPRLSNLAWVLNCRGKMLHG